jgi:hypothetical protein
VIEPARCGPDYLIDCFAPLARLLPARRSHSTTPPADEVE